MKWGEWKKQQVEETEVMGQWSPLGGGGLVGGGGQEKEVARPERGAEGRWAG